MLVPNLNFPTYSSFTELYGIVNVPYKYNTDNDPIKVIKIIFKDSMSI